MRRIAVFIATTAGPVRVARITRERAPQSMVCLKRSSTVLPISAAYDSFVRPGSGVVERVFGPFEDGAFRLDLTGPIDSGDSWQLGFFVAHALAAENTALGAENDAEDIAWLTGEVDCDLGISAVGHIAEKIHASRTAMTGWLAAGRTVSVLVPHGTDHETAIAAGIPDGAKVVAVRSATEALEALRISIPDRAPLARNRAPVLRAERKAPARWLAGGFAAATVAAVTVLHWPVPPATPVAIVKEPIIAQQPAPVAAPIAEVRMQPAPVALPVRAVDEPPRISNLRLLERRAPAGHTCAEVQFGDVAAVETPIAAETSAIDGLCGLGIAVDHGDSADFADVAVDVISGKLLYGTERPAAFGGKKAFAGRTKWAIDLPRRLTEPFEIRVVAVSGPHAVSEEGAWFAAQSDGDTAAKKLEEQGLGAWTVRHRVLP